MNYTMCFACGRDNKIGLKMDFFIDADRKYCSYFTGLPEHVGYDEIMHGGIVAALLDECLARVVIEEGYLAVTAELSVKYVKPTPIGEQLLVRAWIEKNRGKLYTVAGDILLLGGEVTARAKAKIMTLKEHSFEDAEVQPDRSLLVVAQAMAKNS